jgi:hypothetical protein
MCKIWSMQGLCIVITFSDGSCHIFPLEISKDCVLVVTYTIIQLHDATGSSTVSLVSLHVGCQKLCPKVHA